MRTTQLPVQHEPTTPLFVPSHSASPHSLPSMQPNLNNKTPQAQAGTSRLTLIGENTADTPPSAATTHFVVASKAEYGFPEPAVTARWSGGSGGLAGGEGRYPSSVRTLMRVSGRASVLAGSGAEAARGVVARAAVWADRVGAVGEDMVEVGGDGARRSVGRSSIGAGAGSREQCCDDGGDGNVDGNVDEYASGAPRSLSPRSAPIAFSIRRSLSMPSLRSRS